ncbi:hypothetical protein F5Y13DRAFT_202451 [Hypoxylon sp. FL1857]|nr:hypothetical protein F5Y13DRAFT_202451 [Hypoxylon sp. FL1857]
MDSHELQTPSKTRDIIIDSNSPFSPYTPPRDSYPGPTHLDDMDINQKYDARVASTPLNLEELGLVRSHLGDIFHEEASASLRWRPTFQIGWASNLEMAPAPQHQDSDTMHWFPDVCDFANKQTAVYFVGGGYKPNSAGHRHGYTDRWLGCIRVRILRVSVVRVKIGVAMRFLFDLQAEEEAAIPSLRQVLTTLTEERERACHARVESVLQ